MKKELLVEVPVIEELRKLSSSRMLEDGREVLNPEQLYLPLNERPFTMIEQIRRVLRQELSKNALNQGFESFEEADDFDVDEDEMVISSNYEVLDAIEEIPDVDREGELSDKNVQPVRSDNEKDAKLSESEDDDPK